MIDTILAELERNKTRTPHFNYTFKFIFESKFQNTAIFRRELGWLFENWHISIVYSAIYIALVFGGQRLMAKREKFHLHRSLIAWNILLAAFSILGAVRILPNFISMLVENGLDYSICEFELDYGVVGFWTTVFAMSKLIDLFDTAFVVMRKQKLIFLHWYHHAITLTFSWYLLKSFTSIGRWFVAMNFTVHSLMYTYYAFKAARFSIPKRVSLVITSLQLGQMCVGVALNAYALAKKLRGGTCDVPMEGLCFAFFIYFTFFVLFFNFFRNAYLKKKASVVKVCGGVVLSAGGGRDWVQKKVD
jgi:elongation of very long chain fatty acids protein 6